MTPVQPPKHNHDIPAIRRDMADRILKNLIQAQGYVEQLQREIDDERYQHQVGDRSEWRQHTAELLEQLMILRERLESFNLYLDDQETDNA